MGKKDKLEAAADEQPSDKQAAGKAPVQKQEAQEDAPPKDLQAQLDEAQKALDEHNDNYLRLAAELENVRRRSEKKIAEAHQFALSDFALAVGEVRDCLETALESAAEQHDKMHEGVSLTLRKLVAAMDARHILPIKPDIGVAFDPAIHMAIGQQTATAQAAAGAVAAVVQCGYMLNGRVIRAANVIVAADAPAEKPAEDSGSAADAKDGDSK